jgi:hypothetical protein
MINKKLFYKMSYIKKMQLRNHDDNLEGIHIKKNGSITINYNWSMGYKFG